MVEAPGPGFWVLDSTHFTGAVTGFTRELFAEPVTRGFRDGTQPYGTLLDHITWGFVDHWPYLSTRPVPAMAGDGPLEADEWKSLVASSPALADRLATAAHVFPARVWRRDLAYWEQEIKPAAVRQHEQLGRVGPDRLAADALAAHIRECRENLRLSLYRHHRFNVAAVIAVGDFLVHTQEWTGRSGPDVLGVLRGAAPLVVGAQAELDAVAAALRAGPDAAGEAFARYVARVGDWPVGSGADVADPRLLEVPEVMVRNVLAALERGPAIRSESDDGAADLRRAVAPDGRAAFDDLLTEARASYRLRDERATYCDVWAFGLMRRALLSAGSRAVDAGLVHEPVHLLDATYVEVQAVVGGRAEVERSELAERARRRSTAVWSDAAPVLGRPSGRYVPVEWLEAGPARTERAFRAYMTAMSGDDAEAGDGGGGSVKGVAASPGCYDGTARVVLGAEDLSRVEDGDVLVARATSPAFNVVLPFLGAIVTDTGGLLSHAAIVAREFRIPAVVGATDATHRLGDGTRVRVDGDRGEVSPLP